MAKLRTLTWGEPETIDPTGIRQRISLATPLTGGSVPGRAPTAWLTTEPETGATNGTLAIPMGTDSDRLHRAYAEDGETWLHGSLAGAKVALEALIRRAVEAGAITIDGDGSDV